MMVVVVVEVVDVVVVACCHAGMLPCLTVASVVACVAVVFCSRGSQGIFRDQELLHDFATSATPLKQICASRHETSR